MINTVSISDLKQRTADVVKRVKTTGKSVVIMQRSEPTAVLVDPDYYQLLEEALEDLEDLIDIEARKDEPTNSMEDVMKKIAAKK
jgi:prevent-host-death family protein